ncbi:MAG: peroxidase family protein [Acidobacteriota bacterium]|nr:peroxidase family protein [Acidobacteriota bacterium]
MLRSLFLFMAIFAFSTLFSVAQTYQTIDGTGNNVNNPEWGSAGEELLRRVPSAYADGISEPSGPLRPGARYISNLVIAQDSSVLSTVRLSDIAWLWGQFLDHDLDLTEPGDPPEPFNIPVPHCDPFFDPFCTGVQIIPLNRSHHSESPYSIGPRQQINDITAWIDASNVYGSDYDRAKWLRTGYHGKLMVQSHWLLGDLLPWNDGTQPNAPDSSSDFFVAGDIRANENVLLTAMHTLWVREHNRLCDQILSDLSTAESAEAERISLDEYIYQEARQLVIAQMQHITYREFLPALMGGHFSTATYGESYGRLRTLDRYYGYNPNANPGINNHFSTAAYRLGHSMLSSTLKRLNPDGSSIGDLSLADAFFDPWELIDNGGLEPLLRGAAKQRCQEIDNLVIDEVRNFLFGPPGAGGFDLPSLNIQRGRDHGLDVFNAFRKTYDLDPITDFKDLTNDEKTVERLYTAYQGDVNRLDSWVGFITEESFTVKSSIGPTMAKALADQFGRLRDGDRYWYEINLSLSELEWVKGQTLAKVIARNTTIDLSDLQKNVFFAPLSISAEAFTPSE